MMAYTGAKPWHDLANVCLQSDATLEEWLVGAKLNWRVQRRALAMRDNEGNGLRSDTLKDYRAIVRSDNDQVFQVSSNRYQLVQNAEIVEMFREFCDAGHAMMETLGALNNGAVIWALAKMNGGSTVVLEDNDQLNGYIMLSTSHDGSLQTEGRGTQVRTVCGNTFDAARSAGKAPFKLKHSTKFTDEKKAECREMMSRELAHVIRANENAKLLSKVVIDEPAWLDFMSRLMGEDKVLNPKTAELTRIAQDIKDDTILSPGAQLASARGTLWGAVNGVTYYADHRRGRTADSRMMSAWFGNSNELKNSAVNVALDMAGITR